MSKTDKTHPYWVKITRREGAISGFRDYHRCARSGHPDRCSGPHVPMPTTRQGRQRFGDDARMWHGLWRCEIWPRSYGDRTFYPRRPKRATRKALGFEGGIRSRLVAQRLWWRQAGEDVDSLWGAPRRRCQVRDPWSWD